MTGSGIRNSGSLEDVLFPEGTWLQHMCCTAYRRCWKYWNQPEVGWRVRGLDLMEKTRRREVKKQT